MFLLWKFLEELFEESVEGVSDVDEDEFDNLFVSY